MAKSDKSKTAKGDKQGLAPVLKRSPGHLLQRAAQLAADAYAREAGPNAITQRQYAVLAAVEAAQSSDSGPPSQSDLVRLTGIDRSTLADMAGRMIAKGLLERERSTADARANVVRLSEAGRVALEAVRPHVEAADKHILSVLGHGKREAFVKALSKLTRAEAREAAMVEAAAPETESARPTLAAPSGKSSKRGKAKPIDSEPASTEAPFEPARLVAPD